MVAQVGGSFGCRGLEETVPESLYEKRFVNGDIDRTRFMASFGPAWLGYRPKSDRLAPAVVRMIDEGYSRRKVAGELYLSKTTVDEIVKRHRQQTMQPIP